MAVIPLPFELSVEDFVDVSEVDNGGEDSGRKPCSAVWDDREGCNLQKSCLRMRMTKCLSKESEVLHVFRELNNDGSVEVVDRATQPYGP
jgi:hypothetical protein